MHGVSPQPVWTVLDETALRGASSIRVRSPVDWAVGARIVIATTDYYTDLNDVVTITSVSPDGKTIGFTPALASMHWGAGYERAEVGVLDRTITIQGDEQSDEADFGGHIMIRTALAARVTAVQFRRMGQRALRGRYPFHFHQPADVTGLDFYARDCSLHHSYSRCFVLHDTQGALFDNNFAFNVTGHCYFLEEGAERGNTLSNNVAIFVKPGTLLPSDIDPSGFWISNPQNNFTGNHAVGCTHGFWFAMPDRPTGLTKDKYPDVRPRYTPLLHFSHNHAHSMDRKGLFIDDGVEDDLGNVRLMYYSPQATPYVEVNHQTANAISLRTVYSNLVVWKCRQHGVWIRSANYEIRDTVFIDNAVGAQVIGIAAGVVNSLFVGASPNVGNPITGIEIAHGRTLADPRCSGTYCRQVGFEMYDNDGPQHLVDSIFVNFSTSASLYAGAIGQFCERNSHSSLNKVRNVSMINANLVFVDFCTYDGRHPRFDTNLVQENPRSFSYLDMDGTSSSGRPFHWVVANEPIMHADLPADAICEDAPANWAAGQGSLAICPPFLEGFASVQINNMDLSMTNFGSVYSASTKARWISLASPSVRADTSGEDIYTLPVNRYKRVLIGRRAYAFQFLHATPPKLALQVTAAAQGDWVILALSYPRNASFELSSTSPATTLLAAAASREAISAARPWFFDAAAGWLYVYVGAAQTDSIVEYQSFSYSNSNAVVYVTASCGRSCFGPPANESMAVNTVVQEARFQANLAASSTAARNGAASAGLQGLALLSYRPDGMHLAWAVYHNLPTATEAQLVRLPSMAVVRELGALSPPIRSGAVLSADEQADLYAGRLAIQIRSQAGDLSGSVACADSSGCTPAPRSSSLSGGAIAGIVIGVVGAAVLAVVAVYVVVVVSKRKHASHSLTGDSDLSHEAADGEALPLTGSKASSWTSRGSRASRGSYYSKLGTSDGPGDDAQGFASVASSTGKPSSSGSRTGSPSGSSIASDDG